MQNDQWLKNLEKEKRQLDNEERQGRWVFGFSSIFLVLSSILSLLKGGKSDDWQDRQ